MCQVLLEAGDVLLVPKHWWHYVETMGPTPSVSINTWIPVVREGSGGRGEMREGGIGFTSCSVSVGI